jgi:hypothetical protein
VELKVLVGVTANAAELVRLLLQQLEASERYR